MNRPSRIDDARIDNPAFFINLWKMPVFVTKVLREHFDQAQNSLFALSECLVADMQR